MNVSATEAKNRLGQMLDHAQRQPVVIQKGGRRHSVLLSAEQFDALLEAARQAPRTARGKRAAGVAFYESHKAWVDATNDLVHRHGVPGEEFRPW
jgi:prevent-host-death family protein